MDDLRRLLEQRADQVAAAEQCVRIVETAHRLACLRETRGGNAGQMQGRLDAANAAWRQLYAELRDAGLPVEPMAWSEVEAMRPPIDLIGVDAGYAQCPTCYTWIADGVLCPACANGMEAGDG